MKMSTCSTPNCTNAVINAWGYCATCDKIYMQQYGAPTSPSPSGHVFIVSGAGLAECSRCCQKVPVGLVGQYMGNYCPGGMSQTANPVCHNSVCPNLAAPGSTFCGACSATQPLGPSPVVGLGQDESISVVAYPGLFTELPKLKKFESCLACGIEICPELDAYYGVDSTMKALCSKCQKSWKAMS